MFKIFWKYIRGIRKCPKCSEYAYKQYTDVAVVFYTDIAVERSHKFKWKECDDCGYVKVD